MHKHFIRNDSDDERIALGKFLRTIIIYKDETERISIEQSIQNDSLEFEEALTSITPYAYIPEVHTDMARQSYIESLQVVRYIQNKLEKLREEEYPYKLFIKEDSAS